MKKIYAIKSIILCLCIIMFFMLLTIFLLINFQSNYIIGFMVIIFIAAVITAVYKMFALPDCIEISHNNIKIYNFPFFATNNFFEKKQGLVSWNNNICIDEVEKVEIVTLSKFEKIKLIGYNHLFSKYLKLYIRNSNAQKYIYISIYTNKEINELIKCFNK